MKSTDPHEGERMKRCVCCHVVLPETSFPSNGLGRRKVRCPRCHYQHAAARGERERARLFAKSENGRAIRRRAGAAYREKHPERVRAGKSTYQARKRGVLAVPATCTALGCTAPAAHGHHENYAKPLAVTYLCQRHHEEAHHRRGVPIKWQAGGILFATAPPPKREPARTPPRRHRQRSAKPVQLDLFRSVAT